MTNLFYLSLLLLLRSRFSSGDPLVHSCGVGNYTSDSKYKSNLNQLLHILTSTHSTFTTKTTGSAPDTAYGLFLCRGDVGPSDCRVCVQNAAIDVLSLCPGGKQATVWYDNCELRYSNLRFFSSLDYTGSWIMWNVQNVTGSVQDFIRLRTKLLDEIDNYAVHNSPAMFATGTATSGSGGGVRINALAQCTRDLSADGCGQCLQQIRGLYTGHEASQGGRVLAKSCNFRFEIYEFYQGKPDVVLDPTSPMKPPTLPPAPKKTLGTLSLLQPDEGKI